MDAGHLKAWKTVGGHRRIDAASLETLIKWQAEFGALSQPFARPLRAMIVDDNIDDREVLSALVSAALPSAEITTAENGFAALLAVRETLPDLIVTDIVMPHMNGLEMLRHLLEGTTHKPRLAIAVSSYSPDQLASLGGLPPEVAFIPKPVDPPVFLGMLRKSFSAVVTP
ncbi:hypothetical protein ASF44_10650 [Pseudorhodoferax sp. Leaf274]|nr:hypothetical protein ASF44_10650 [Pseudorhodoferax sp. Leaf274]